VATEAPVLVTLLALVALLAPPPAGALRRGAVHERRSPDGYTVVTVELAYAVRLTIPMAPGGGWVGRFTRGTR